MSENLRFDKAIEQIDAANQEDPRKDIVDGQPIARELLFSRCVYDWVTRLVNGPSEELLLAARAHTLRRWMVPREQYMMNTPGYHEWRDACAKHHAQQARQILQDVGYHETMLDRVETLILRSHWPEDPEAQTLEDADCLAFLETKLHQYLDEWDDAKMERILIGTLRKMTPKGREQIAKLELGKRKRALLQRVSQVSGNH